MPHYLKKPHQPHHRKGVQLTVLMEVVQQFLPPTLASARVDCFEVRLLGGQAVVDLVEVVVVQVWGDGG